MNKKLIILTICLFPILGFKTSPNFTLNAKIQAIFIYNFTKYIEWPPKYRQGNFVVGIIGNSQGLYEQLEQMAQVKRVSNKALIVKKFSSVNSIQKCNIIFVSKDKSGSLSSITAKLRHTGTLIITESPGLASKGSGINFVVINNRQKFEMNVKSLAKHNLKVNNVLESLAILVN